MECTMEYDAMNLYGMTKRMLVTLMFVASLLIISLNGYTFRVCYNGSDDPEVVAPDAISVSSVIHGGNTCWANFDPAKFIDEPWVHVGPFYDNFTVDLKKGEFKDIVASKLIPNPLWNCYLLPETVNGNTINRLSDNRPSKKKQGPDEHGLFGEGETWQIKKSKAIIKKRPDLGIKFPRRIVQPRTYSIDWYADIEDGIKKCKPFETVTKKQPSVTKKYKNMSADEQATLRRDWFDAAFNHRLDEMKEIVGMGIDVNLKDDDGDSALLLALRYNPSINSCWSDTIVSIVELLLNNDADAAIISEMPFLKAKKWPLSLVATWAAICLSDAGGFVSCKCPVGVVAQVMNLLLEHGAAGKNNQLARDAMPMAQSTSKVTNGENKEAEDALRAYLEKNK